MLTYKHFLFVAYVNLVASMLSAWEGNKSYIIHVRSCQQYDKGGLVNVFLTQFKSDHAVIYLEFCIVSKQTLVKKFQLINTLQYCTYFFPGENIVGAKVIVVQKLTTCVHVCIIKLVATICYFVSIICMYSLISIYSFIEPPSLNKDVIVIIIITCLIRVNN